MYGLMIVGIVFMSIAILCLIGCIIFETTSCRQHQYWLSVLFGVFMFAGLLIIPIAQRNLIEAESEYYAFIETKEMVEYMIDPKQGLANIDLTSTVDNMNQWLIDARWSQRRWGNLSRYYKLDLDSLEYITMKVGD